MFIPNTTAQMSRQSAGFDKFGVQLYGAPFTVSCAIVALSDERMKTPVRTDTSASRGQSDEDVDMGTVLLPAAIKPKVGDRFVIFDFSMRFLSTQPRLSTSGVLDHWECKLEADPVTGAS